MYQFDFATEDENMITRYIRYAALRTDASWDYHEAAAIWMLSVLSKHMRAKRPQYANDLPANLYILIVGSTSISHKTTSVNFVKKIVSQVIPGGLLEEQMTPEALIEQMALKGESPAAWAPDEFSFMFKAMQHKSYMKDFPEKLMRLYDGNDYDIARHSKRIKGGDKEDDKEILKKPHLCIIAPTTEAVFSVLTHEHLESGLLPRFAIVMPSTKPPDKALWEYTEEDAAKADQLEIELTAWASTIFAYCNQTPTVKFSVEALKAVHEFSLESQAMDAKSPDSAGSYMRKRLEGVCMKLAMLVTLGNPAVYAKPDEDVIIREPAMQAAMKIARKWRGYAEEFAARVAETDFEGKLQRGLKLLESNKMVRRDQFARHLKVPHNQLQSIVDTLMIRGQVAMTNGDGPHPKLHYIDGKPQAMEEVKV